MRIIQLNTVAGYGSTGSIVCDIADELTKYGEECTVLYGQKKTSQGKGVYFGIKVENKIHSLLSRIFGIQGVFSWIGTIRIINYINKYNPDAIHIHNLHGNYICYPLLYLYIIKKKIPIVYTLHDCWLYTGKCAHYIDVKCNRWEHSCYECPKKKEYPPSYLFDMSRIGYKLKKAFFPRIEKGAVVGVSNWIANESKKSFLNKLDISVIYNWIDTGIFCPTYNRQYCSRIGIAEDKYVILGVCGRWSKAKGIEDWIRLKESLSEEYQIVLVGRMDDTRVLPSQYIHVPYTSNQKELATLYTRADLFLNLSEAETFGKTTAEALACGTPVVVYNTTACPELVGQGCGMVVEDFNEIINAINSIQMGEADTDRLKCREYVKENFDKTENIKEYYNLYKKIVSKNYV